DCGKAINPQIVAGQTHGAFGHGIGAAIMETFQYDEIGNLLTSTFSDYVPITALNIPDVKYGHIETPSPFTFNGAKGCGEGGGGPLLTVSAALQDALFSEGIIIQDSHHSPPAVFEVMCDANRERVVTVETR
ncbi:MAG: molybdopterin cofactor-binding domain-containing protein, partial [Pseudomonadota bacterium]|nr:molybdopterin cofactor-binding domain-containing protein [Pseudomonadota bacterium]